MCHVKSICWWIVPLLVGAAAGFALTGNSPPAPGGGVAPVDGEPPGQTPPDGQVKKKANREPLPAQPPPADLEEFLALAAELGGHHHTSVTRLSRALREVDDGQILAWYRALIKLVDYRGNHLEQSYIGVALFAVAERLVKSFPEIAFEERVNYHEFDTLLAANYPDRVPEFLSRLGDRHARRSLLSARLIMIKGEDAAATQALRREYIEAHGNAEDLKAYENEMAAEVRSREMYEISHTLDELFDLMRLQDASTGGNGADSSAGVAAQIVRQFRSATDALAFAERNGIGEMSERVRSRFYSDAFSQYMYEDSDAAVAWLGGQPDDVVKGALAHRFWSVARADAKLARDLVERLDASLLPAQAIGQVAHHWGQHSDEKAEAFAWYIEQTGGGAKVKGDNDFGQNLMSFGQLGASAGGRLYR